MEILTEVLADSDLQEKPPTEDEIFARNFFNRAYLLEQSRKYSDNAAVDVS